MKRLAALLAGRIGPTRLASRGGCGADHASTPGRPSQPAARGVMIPPRPVRWLIFLGLIAAVAAIGFARTQEAGPRPSTGQRRSEIRARRCPNRPDQPALGLPGRVVVVVFVGTSCPVGDLYMPRLVELSRRYEIAERRLSGDQFQRKRHGRRRRRLCPAIASDVFPILKDIDNRVADSFWPSEPARHW